MESMQSVRGGGRWGWGKVQLHVSHRRTRISPLAERFEKSRGEDCLGSNTYNYQYQILSSSCISRPQSFLAGEETLALKRLWRLPGYIKWTWISLDPEYSPEALDTHTRNFRCQTVDVFNLLHDRLQYTEDGGTFGCCAKKPANW